MADSVQRLLEDMVPELEDFQKKGIFSPAEVKSIVARRTALEYRLKRKPPLKEDFDKYIQYETKLNKLRELRKERLGFRKNSSSDYAMVRRIHFIYERCVRTFSNNVDLWLELAGFCVDMGSSKRLGKLLPRALQLHPLCVRLWIKAATIEAELNNHIHSARVLMQRALRLNATSTELWLAFLHMEIKYILKLHQRKLVLLKDSDEEKDEEEPDEDKEEENEELRAQESQQANDAKFMGGALPAALFTHAIKEKTIAKNLGFRLKALSLIPSELKLRIFRQTVESDLEVSFHDDPKGWVTRAKWLVQSAAPHAAEPEPETKTRPKKRTKKTLPKVSPGESAALQLLEAGIEELGTAAMYQEVGKFVQQRLAAAEERDAEADVEWLRQKLWDVCSRAKEADELTSPLCSTWITCLLQDGQQNEAMDVASLAVEEFPAEVSLWKLLCHIVTKAQSSDSVGEAVVEVYTRAFASVQGDASQILWADYLHTYISQGTAEECEACFTEAIRLHPGFKHLYVDWHLAQLQEGDSLRGLVRVCNKVLSAPPVSQALYFKCIRILRAVIHSESSASKRSGHQRRLLQVCEASVSQYPTSVDLWLLYIRWLRSGARDDSVAVYQRALLALPPSAHSRFTVEYDRDLS